MGTQFKKILLGLTVLLLAYSLSQNILNYKRQTSFFSQYQQSFDEVSTTNRELKTEILKHKDLYQVERDIRDKLGKSKPNEVVLILPEITPILSPTPTPYKPPAQQWAELFAPQNMF